jgi:hypothetical protein
MYQWERDALGIDTLGELKGGVRVRARVEGSFDQAGAWWVSALFAPDIWKTWRVGVLRRPVGFAVVFAPTNLRSRLGLSDGQEVELHLLPADKYQPDPRRQVAQGD